MQEEPTPDAALLASVCPERHFTKALDHLELALDLSNVVSLALRAEDFHDPSLVKSIAEVTDAMTELLKNAKTNLVDEAYALRREASVGDHEH